MLAAPMRVAQCTGVRLEDRTKLGWGRDDLGN
jgi:hypothetical protein